MSPSVCCYLNLESEAFTRTSLCQTIEKDWGRGVQKQCNVSLNPVQVASTTSPESTHFFPPPPPSTIPVQATSIARCHNSLLAVPRLPL